MTAVTTTRAGHAPFTMGVTLADAIPALAESVAAMKAGI